MQEGSCNHRATIPQQHQYWQGLLGVPRPHSVAAPSWQHSTCGCDPGQCRATGPGSTHLGFKEVDIAHQSPAAHQLHLHAEPKQPLSLAPRPSPVCPSPRPLPPPLPAAPRPAQRTRWAEKDCRLLFQKASTKILLYLMAMGHTVAPAGQHSTARTSQQAQHG